MRRLAYALGGAVAAALIAAACGGNGYTPPTPGGSNGGNSGGGGPVTPNTPPVVKSVTVSDARIEVGSPVTFTATVEDLETPIANLQFSWEFPQGSTLATGNGSSITWTPGANLSTPLDFTVKVTVTERYTSGGVQAENTASGTVDIHVNNSPKELAELSLRFLGDFADSKVSPDRCVSEFSDTSCSRGKGDEFTDISNNRHDFLILASTLRHTSLSIAPARTSATVHTFCAFTSRVVATDPRSCSKVDCPFGSVQSVEGDCFTTNVYERGRWWLCESHFTGTKLGAFARAFFGIRGGE